MDFWSKFQILKHYGNMYYHSVNEIANKIKYSKNKRK
jgi:hypothetical protein